MRNPNANGFLVLLVMVALAIIAVIPARDASAFAAAEDRICPGR
jgi:type II secretory pathway component PulJ